MVETAHCWQVWLVGIICECLLPCSSASNTYSLLALCVKLCTASALWRLFLCVFPCGSGSCCSFMLTPLAQSTRHNNREAASLFCVGLQGPNHLVFQSNDARFSKRKSYSVLPRPQTRIIGEPCAASVARNGIHLGLSLLGG